MTNPSPYQASYTGRWRIGRKIWMIMRLITLFIFVFTMAVSAKSYSQKVNLSEKDVPLEKILRQIREQTSCSLLWGKQALKGLPPVSVFLRDASLEEAIKTSLKGLPLTYTIHGDVVYVERKQYAFLSMNPQVASPVAQQHEITGTVVDSATGEPLAGVTIRVKGSNKGTTTDTDGKFSLEVEDNNVLIVSYLGYNSREVLVGDKKNMHIFLSAKPTGLDQLVVVGYGTQKKITVTGAVSSIGTKELTQSPVANISNSLVGRLPGLLAMQRGGQPGEDQSIVRIRGIGTYAGSNDPLVLVDGIESQNYNNIDPNEIESITILKDASATAVYGVRGANGVILITTKRGKVGKPQMSFTSNFAISGFTDLRKNAGSYDYARLYNEALKYDSYITHSNKEKYTAEEIEKYKSGNDPLFYPDVDWPKVFWRKWAPQMQHNLTFSGGTKRVRYHSSVGFFKQEGLFSNKISDWVNEYDPQIKFNRYNFRNNLDFDVARGLTAKVDVSYQIEQRRGNGEGINRLIQLMEKAAPNVSPGIYDGKLITLGIEGEEGTVPPDKLLRQGYQRSDRNYLTGSVRMNYDLGFVTKGLSTRGAVSYQGYNTQVETFNRTPVSYQPKRLPNDDILYVPVSEETTFSYSQSVNHHRRVYAEFGFEYSRSFGDHNIGGLLLYNQSKLHDPGLEFLVPKGYQGLVGRVTYNYKNRYMAEFDGGYNGTENFAKGKRFGFFPAVSVGWVVSNEPFFAKNPVVSLVKFRASWGEVGNDQIGGDRFLYLPSSYNYVSDIYNFGTSGADFQSYQGSEEGKIGNPDLTWERARKLDIGMDASFFEDKFKVTVDWFHEKRDNILSGLKTIPVVVAANLPAYNLGRMKNGGVDGDITYNDNIGKFYFWIKANYTYARNTVLFQDEVDHPYSYMDGTGHRYGQKFGFISDGFYNTWDEVNKVNRPVYQDQNDRIQPGDLKYVDVNGDGMIDLYDQVPIGYSDFPEKIIGFSLGGSYKGFDFSVLFQGAGNVSVSYSSLARWGFRQGYAIPEYLAEYSWTSERYESGEIIKFPHLSEGDVNQKSNYANSTFWIRDASYLRMKNAEVGYTFDDALLRKIGIHSLRVYVNGNNLLTWDSMLPGIDPESSVSQSLWEPYPVTQTFNFGFKFNF